MLRNLRYAHQLDYMHTLIKPGNKTVQDFLCSFKALNVIATKFPDAPAHATSLSRDEFRRVFFQKTELCLKEDETTIETEIAGPAAITKTVRMEIEIMAETMVPNVILISDLKALVLWMDIEITSGTCVSEIPMGLKQGCVQVKRKVNV